MPRPLQSFIAALAAVTMVSVAVAEAPRSPTPSAVDAPIKATTFADNLEHPWGAAFLPDGRMLVTEKPGRLRVVDREGRVSAPLDGVPRVFASGQGGVLDVAVSPTFSRHGIVYLSFT